MAITTPTPATPTEELLGVPATGAAGPGTVDAGAALEVEYTADGASLRVTTGPDDADNGARLLCAAVSHVRRRHGRRVRTVLDIGTPTSWALLEAMQSRVGTDVADVVLRRAGSSVMVTLELLPVGARDAGPRGTGGRAATARNAGATHATLGERPRGRAAHGVPSARSRATRTSPR